MPCSFDLEPFEMVWCFGSLSHYRHHEVTTTVSLFSSVNYYCYCYSHCRGDCCVLRFIWVKFFVIHLVSNQALIVCKGTVDHLEMNFNVNSTAFMCCLYYHRFCRFDHRHSMLLTCVRLFFLLTSNRRQRIQTLAWLHFGALASHIFGALDAQ